MPATAAGYEQLLSCLDGHGRVDRVGVEGTGSYSAVLSRVLASRGMAVVEVDRPDRAAAGTNGNSDPLDAEAGRAGRRATSEPKAP